MVMDRLRGVPLTDLDAVRSITTGQSHRVYCTAFGTSPGAAGAVQLARVCCHLAARTECITVGPHLGCKHAAFIDCATAARLYCAAVEPELVLINALNTWFGSVVGCETFHAGEGSRGQQGPACSLWDCMHWVNSWKAGSTLMLLFLLAAAPNHHLSDSTRLRSHGG